MHKLICLISLLCLSLHTQAQVNTDSLRTVFHDESLADTLRLRAADQIAKGYQNQPDSALHFRELQYDLAKSTGNKRWMGTALNWIGYIYMNEGDNAQAIEYYSRSLKIHEEMGDKKGVIVPLNKIADMYMKEGDNVQALEYNHRSLKVIEEVGDKKRMSLRLHRIGFIYAEQSDFARALEYYNQALKINEEIGKKKSTANVLNNIGSIYKQQGDFVRAIECYGKALKINEEIGNKKSTARTLNSIGTIYSMQGDDASRLQAIEYYDRSMKMHEEIGNKTGVSTALINKGIIYAELGDHASTLKYYHQALKIDEETGDKKNIANSLVNIGIIYKNQDDYVKALEYFDRSLKIAEEVGNKYELANSLHSIGNTYELQGDFARAIPYGERALLMAQEGDLLLNIRRAAKLLYKSYKAIGRSAPALEMLELYISSRDSLGSRENQRATMRYEYQQKALQDSLSEEKERFGIQLAHEKAINKESNIRNIAIGLGLLIFLIASGLWSRNRFTQKTNAQLKAAKTRAEHSERVKEQFLANMSHEIRTPMHAISGMLKILERNEHPKAQEVFLDAMHKSSDNLIVLLNDILDLSKIEAGKLDVESIPMQPAEVLGTVEQILRFKASEKGLQLHTSYSPDLPPTLMGDPTRLGQILTNLAGNAIKFTEKGSVSISASRKGDFLLYEVRDTGIGIAEDKLLSIFDAFEQAEGSTARRFGGTGLGLNISRQLVELMGGNIWAESEMGKGSAFFVSLPLVAVEGEVADKQSLSEAQILEMGTALAGKRILLAEDNEFNQMIATDDLAYYAKGIQVDIVENGALALEKAKTGLYDLILMDVQMPEMDGVEASLKIREWEQANGKARIPIIAMTASLLKSEVNLCIEAGMDNYVPKPYQPEELIGPMFSEMNKNQVK